MPLYEYQCASCQKVHEVMQKFSDAPMETCPDCSGQVTKLISMSSFALKGTGWYTTDYKRGGATPKREGGEAATAVSESSAPAKTEAVAAPAAATPAPKSGDSKP